MISKNAIIHPDAKLADEVTVDHFAIIEADVTIGNGTYIGPNTVIHSGAIIGENCKIGCGSVIAGEPQDLKFKGEKTTVVIGNNNTIKEYVTVNRGTAAKGTTIIGNNCLLMAYVHVGHDCVIKDNVVLVNRTSLAGEVVVEDWAIVAGHCGVHQFTHIGAHSMIGGLLKVSKDVPPYTKAAHEQLSFVGINSVGLRRRGFSEEEVNEIQDIYRVIFQSGLAMRNALNRVEEEFQPSKHRDAILGFIRNSSRGVIKSYRSITEEL